MHRTSHTLSRACKQLLCESAPEEPSTLLVDVYVDGNNLSYTTVSSESNRSRQSRQETKIGGLVYTL